MPSQPPTFEQPDLAAHLASLDAAGLDALGFGTIGFDDAEVVVDYNVFESRAAGLTREQVIGQAVFTSVAPCMNNFLVAQRFVDAAAQALPLDETLDYVLTLRMKPVKVRLRLLARPGDRRRWILVDRRP